MGEREDDRETLLAEIERLRLRLQEAEDALDAIRNGEVDARAMPGPHGDQTHSLSGANQGYRTFFETMNHGAVILGSNGTIFSCNAMLSEMLKTPMEAISGGSILDFTTRPDIPLMEGLLERGLGEPVSMEISLKSQDGTIVPCCVSANPFSVEDSSAICMILTDVTQRKQVEEDRIRSSEDTHQLTGARDQLRVAQHELELANADLSRTDHRLRALMDALPVGVCFSNDPSCEGITGNRWLLHQFEVTPDDNLSASAPDPAALGRLLRWFRDGREVGASELPLHKSVAERRVIPPVELEVHLPSGRRCIIESSASPIFDEQGSVSGGLAVIVDVTQRKTAEEAMRSSEKAYRNLAENIPGIVYRVHFDDGPTMEFFNETVESITGFKKDELKRGRVCSIDPLILADDRSTVVELVEKACAANTPFEIEYRIRHKDGSIKHLVEYGRPILDTARSPLLIDGVIFDITDRKKAEERLRESEERFRLAMDATHDGVWDWDVRSGEVYRSRAFFEMLGYQPEEFPPGFDGWKSLVHPDDSEQVLTQLDDYLYGRAESYEVEFRMYSKSNGLKWILSRGKLVDWDESGNPLRMIGTHTDITDRKRAEDALRQSEELFRAIFEDATDCIWIKDHSGRFTHANPAMCKNVGLPASSIVGRKIKDIFGEEAARQIRALDRRVLAGETIRLEQARRVQGTTIRFDDVLAPLRDQTGETVGIFCISREIAVPNGSAETVSTEDDAYSAPAMKVALGQARKAATGTGIVLLEGESGSGKDFLARWIHDHSECSNGPYFSINCAAVPKELAESELFGHERGSFTGALGMKKGLLELAEGGTILLNEIGELPLPLQAKILTFLDTRSFMRVGGQRHINVNARLIAATHRDLRSEVQQRRFLEPLFYRLNVFPIRVPALRERIDDLPVLVDELIAKLASELGLVEVPVIGASEIATLSKYEWPGNIRQLRNTLERSLMLWDGGPLTVHMPKARRPRKTPQTESSDREWSYVVRYSPDKGITDVVQEVETSLYEYVLKLAHYNKIEAAKLLKISRGTLYRYIKKWEGKGKG